MDFGIFSMFTTRVGATHAQTFKEWFERLSRLSNVGYDDVLKRVAYGTPEAVVDRLEQYREELGITGVSLEMNPGGGRCPTTGSSTPSDCSPTR